ncbi:MAG: energy-coupling factor transporter transmembrane component T [Eggerthellaceae bacterium]
MLDLDPRTIMGVLLGRRWWPSCRASRLSWASCWAWRCCRLTGHVRMALAFAGGYAVLWAVLNLVFPHVGGVAATMFTIASRSRARSSYCLMVGSLLVAELGAPSDAALERLRVPGGAHPLTVTMRYFPALKDEMAHIRGAMRLRDIPSSGWNAVVPLIMSATTADELSRAATCREHREPGALYRHRAAAHAPPIKRCSRRPRRRCGRGAVGRGVLMAAARQCAEARGDRRGARRRAPVVVRLRDTSCRGAGDALIWTAWTSPCAVAVPCCWQGARAWERPR